MTDHPRLSNATLALATNRLERPRYDREKVEAGVVHFGPGAFHRAHQAYAFDRLLQNDPRFGVCTASLRSDDLRAALAPQDGLYILAQRDAEARFLAIGALVERLTAPREPEALRRRLADARVQVMTSTVTEKGYCLKANGDLDFDHPDIAADLKGDATPRSLIGWLVQAYADRKAARLPAFLAAPCDNLSGNGEKLRNAVIAFAATRDRDLARWIDAEAAFASTMVDSITPATDDDLRALVQAECGLVDAWPVQREAFVQWVVERTDAKGQPDWAAAGVTLTSDVGAFERAKLRLLNGAHSTLAYLGLLAGYATVSQAVADPALRGFIVQMWADEIAPGLTAPPGLDLGAYQADLLRRFDNPVLSHHLSQIAWDGSQKVPVRLVSAITDAAAAGRPFHRLALGVAGWMMFITRRASSGLDIVDPLAKTLVTVGQSGSRQARDLVPAFLALDQVFPREFSSNPGIRAALVSAFQRLSDLGPMRAASGCNGADGA